MCVCENKSIFPVILDKPKIIIIKQQQQGKKILFWSLYLEEN